MGDDFKRVNIQSAESVSSISAKHGVHDGHLENFVALFFAAAEPFVNRAVHEARIHLQQGFIFSLTSLRNSTASSSFCLRCLRTALTAALRK